MHERVRHHGPLFWMLTPQLETNIRLDGEDKEAGDDGGTEVWHGSRLKAGAQ